MKLIHIILFTCLGTQCLLADDWDPLEDEANYEVVKDSKRTSNLIKSGSLFAKTLEERTKEEDYLLQLDFEAKTSLSTEKGTIKLGIPWDYYEDGFLDELESSQKPYETPEYKLEFLERKDVILKDGRSYKKTYLIRIFDIKAKVIMSNDFGEQEFKNPEILAAIVPGMEVIGAVQLDLTGEYGILDLKVGADLVD